MLARASEAVTRVLNELHKMERVDDVNSKLIFLNNTLDAIRAGQRHADAMRSYLPPQEDWAPVAEIWRNDPQLQVVEPEIQGDQRDRRSHAGLARWATSTGGATTRAIRLVEEIDKHAKQVGRHFTTSAPYPEAIPLRQMLDHWQEHHHERVKDLQGRAALVSTIKTRQLNFAPVCR